MIPGNPPDQLRRLQRAASSIHDELRVEAQQDPREVQRPQIFVAKTGGTGIAYPEPGANKYPIVFQSPNFDNTTAGNEEVDFIAGDTAYENIAAQIGEPGDYLPSGTPAFVAEVENKYYILGKASEGEGQGAHVRFELTTPLNLGGQAMARVVVWSDAAADYVMFGDEFPIFDWRPPPGRFAGYPTPGLGLPGYRGTARFGDRQVFEVVTMDRAPRFAVFTLPVGKDFAVEGDGENWARNVQATYTFDGKAASIIDLHDRCKFFLGVKGGNVVPLGGTGPEPLCGIAVFDDEASTFDSEFSNLVYQPLLINLPRGSRRCDLEGGAGASSTGVGDEKQLTFASHRPSATNFPEFSVNIVAGTIEILQSGWYLFSCQVPFNVGDPSPSSDVHFWRAAAGVALRNVAGGVPSFELAFGEVTGGRFLNADVFIMAGSRVVYCEAGYEMALIFRLLLATGSRIDFSGESIETADVSLTASAGQGGVSSEVAVSRKFSVMPVNQGIAGS